MQVAGQVDTLIDRQDTAAAVPLMRNAAAEVLAGRNKWLAWSSGGPLPCPLAEPLCPGSGRACVESFKLKIRARRGVNPLAGSPFTCSVAEQSFNLACIDSSNMNTMAGHHAQTGSQATNDADPVRRNGASEIIERVSNAPKLEEPLEPLFLARFDAAWIHCELATMYVSYLERQKEYREACELLQALIGGSACPSRRCGPSTLSALTCDPGHQVKKVGSLERSVSMPALAIYTLARAVGATGGYDWRSTTSTSATQCVRSRSPSPRSRTCGCVAAHASTCSGACCASESPRGGGGGLRGQLRLRGSPLCCT